jgi:hypothetical protein
MPSKKEKTEKAEKSKKKKDDNKETKKKKKQSNDDKPDEVENALDVHKENLAKLKEVYDLFKKNTKPLEKELKKKKGKESKPREYKSKKLPKELAKLLGAKEMNQNEMRSAISKYAKENELTSTKKSEKGPPKVTITANKALAKALNSDGVPVKDKQKLSFGDISKILGKNGLFPPSEEEAPAAKKKKKAAESDED